MPVSLIERADFYASELAKEHPGLQITRTDAMRMILAKHLPLVPSASESKSTKPSPSKPSQSGPSKKGGGGFAKR